MTGRRSAASESVGLTAAAVVNLTLRRFRDEWRSTSVYAMGLSRTRPIGLAGAARDFRPVDADLGRELLKGRLTLAGVSLPLNGRGDVWELPSPNRPFAVELHRYTWLPSLLRQGPEGVAEALRLVMEWDRAFNRVAPFVWGSETLTRRVFNLACGLKRLLDRASEAEGAHLLQSLAKQANHLLRLDGGPPSDCQNAAVAALVGTALAGDAGERLCAQALVKLTRAVAADVLTDGGLRTRCPEEGLELLFDLLSLDDLLLQRGREAPEALTRTIDRLTQAVKFFTLGDGRLSAFQGGEAASARRVTAALAHDDGEGRVFSHLPYTGYHRLVSRDLVVMVDAAPPAKGPWSVNACSQPLALEITCGGDRLIANCGWSPDARGPQGFRMSAGGSTATLADGSAGRILTGLQARGLGLRLKGGPTDVKAVRQENNNGVWLELAHDAWAEELGLIHVRRLFLDAALDELRGEDRFEPMRRTGPQRGPSGVQTRPSYAVRFHLPPDVNVSLARDQRSVLLRGPSNRGWWFRNDAPNVLLETSTVFEDHRPNRASQVVLMGLIDTSTGACVRWKLSPVDPETSSAFPPADDLTPEPPPSDFASFQ